MAYNIFNLYSGNLYTLFRGESSTTHLLSYFMKKIGIKYLSAIVEPTIEYIINNNSNYITRFK